MGKRISFEYLRTPERITVNGVYKMKLGNYYLRVKDTSAGNGAKLELVSSSDSSNRYLFTVTPTTDGAFTISNVYTGATRYLDSTNGETQTAEDGSYVTLRNQPTNNSCQKWYLVEDYTEEVTTGRKIVTSATYTDNQNFLSTQTDQAGNTMSYNYNTTDGTLTSTTNAAGITTSYQYDQSNNALLSVSSGGMTNSYTYSNDRLTDINVNGATRYSFEYDEFGRTTATKVGNGSSYLTLSSLTYNNRNLLSRQTYGNGDYIEYTYDSLDRIVEQSYNNNIGKKQIAYGSDGNISSTVDFASNTHTRFAYDLAGRVRSIREYEGTALSGKILYSSTDYSYADKTNYLTGVNHFSPLGTQKIGYTYGNLSQGTMPDQVYGVSWNSVLKLSNAYDTLARLSKRTINGLDTNYTYVDRENNLTTTLVSSVSTLGITHSYTYDSLGNITSVSNGSNTVTYEYDSLNQLVRVNDPDENQTHIYTYVNGNITEDRVFAYTTAETPANPQRATQYLYQNPVWSDVVTGVKEVYFTEDGEGLQSIRNGNITDNLDSTLATRVLGEHYEKVDLSARFKAQREGLVPAEREIAEQNSVIVDNEYSVTSDEIGNITALGDNTYTWHGRQLQSISNDGIATNYSYNADGQRIGKTITLDDSSYNYTYYYNGDILAGYILTLTEGEDSQTYNVVFMYDENGEPFGFTVNGDSYYYVRNAQNDVYMIVDSDNQAVVLYQYDAWGKITGCYDTSDGNILSLVNPYTYRGYYYDIESGQYYLKTRYYSPELHRFMCADNVIILDESDYNQLISDNIFTYCLNNPVNLYDPSGCMAEVLTGASYTAAFAFAAANSWNLVGQAILVVMVIATVVIAGLIVYQKVKSKYNPDPYGRKGQKKQGRELKGKSRKNKDFKPRNNKRDNKPAQPKKHTPGKNHRKYK
ncbi:MAG: hypothetical protein IJL63_09600 [Clostridia bacterium]|nr:hypothetical protein [Clostridia bacterium]